MRSIKQQVFLLLMWPLITVFLTTTLVGGGLSKENADHAAQAKLKSDLATGEALLDYLYPGPWESREGVIYKGGIKINQNSIPVDRIAELTDDNVTIFSGDTRIATTVRVNYGERAIGTRAAENVATSVLKNGQLYFGESNVVGDINMTGYKPIRDQNGNIIGMISVGISSNVVSHLLRDYLFKIILCNSAIALALILVGWFLVRRRLLDPLEAMKQSMWEFANSQGIDYVQPRTVDGLAQRFTGILGQKAGSLPVSESCAAKGPVDTDTDANAGLGDNHGQETGNGNFSYIEPFPSSSKIVPMPSKGELPKGLNQATMQQIMAYLSSRNEPMSAEEVGEGVNITRVTARRYLEHLEQCGRVKIIIKYGTVGRPVKLYKVELKE